MYFTKQPRFLDSRATIAALLIALGAGYTAWMESDFPGGASMFRLPYLILVIAATWHVNAWFGVLLLPIALFAPNFVGPWDATAVSRDQLVESASRLGECGLAIFLTAVLRRSHHRLHDLANRDPLTGLLNRSEFLKQAATEMNRSSRRGHVLTVAYLDCDRFKEINDTLGHLTGDDYLKRVAVALRSSMRSYDLIGRMGGDEFSLLFPETDSAAARAATERIRSRLKQEFDMQEWPVTFSIGVATFQVIPSSPEELVAAADKAMYTVKHSSGNGVQYTTVTA